MDIDSIVRIISFEHLLFVGDTNLEDSCHLSGTLRFKILVRWVCFHFPYVYKNSVLDIGEIKGHSL